MCVFNREVVKLAVVPAALGLASFRVYATPEEKTDKQISPHEVRDALIRVHTPTSSYSVSLSSDSNVIERDVSIFLPSSSVVVDLQHRASSTTVCGGETRTPADKLRADERKASVLCQSCRGEHQAGEIMSFIKQPIIALWIYKQF